ncbi:tRNA (adenosine(37)-N6)-threonylcarbamoyltransferase complex dimerization subunit type 1 TsaB [Brevibacterium sp. 50QC2O2]|uniref:tRNA (adenosine(37)-N6)-threonylcarbamoyltransferase complex dimerization subunit type 1 TsaB n=1 Tax=Brevibacterium TaxID=1696 RepID=UPI00211C5F28|nr:MULTISPECIES: tRNA (adenosine(37)-N6)-threonylcarbamoyltransferase complex dimerization subunit type 1 TsaB [unclassified Brevibacterium]MCQ9384559.1 tRNA (adenosine(37)-N6)-threonylcarbamoyltransferase complex dimerization subunit type 1 TsaB [Brevibacterium sp. 68QC2CO]MCQ9387889.1 tRNA (adenosine(37)-N6)-threonylcarbamoyltransferase complex dimerization subunit type 1 TsaB [Brevibacterium sp. 50QC2O2]
MITLALDSSGAASAAILDGETVVAQWSETHARKHAEHLGPALQELLAAAPSIDQVIVGVGPAPFTGLRAGIAMGLGAAVGRDVPIAGWPSHDGLALRVYGRPQAAGRTLLVATDARRKEVYWTLYRGLDEAGLPVVVSGPDVSKPADLAAVHPRAGVLHAGIGFDLYTELLGASDFPQCAEPLAADVARAALRARAAGRELLPVTPLYLREPDAKPLHA